MKKIIVFALIAITGFALLSSCASTKRGTGCPMTENIIH